MFLIINQICVNYKFCDIEKLYNFKITVLIVRIRISAKIRSENRWKSREV